MKLTRKDWLTLIALILIATVLRFYRISFQSMWLDEILSIETSQMDLSHLFQRRANDFNPPLYDILLKLVLEAMPISEFSARFLSAVAGIAVTGVFFLIGKRWFTYTAGALAGFLWATAPPAVYYSQEARPYTLLTLFSLLNLFFTFEVFFENENRRSKWLAAGYVLTASVLMWLHYSGVVYVFVSSLVWLTYLFCYSRDKIKFFLLLSFITLLLYTPWLKIIFYQFIFAWPPHIQTTPPGFFEMAAAFIDFALPHARWIKGVILLLALCGLVWPLFVRSSQGVRGRWADYKKELICLSIAAGYLFLVFAVFQLKGQGKFFPNHAIVVLPMTVLAATLLCLRLPYNRYMAFFLACFLGQASYEILLVPNGQYFSVIKTPYRSVAEHILLLSKVPEFNVPVLTYEMYPCLAFYLKMLGPRQEVYTAGPYSYPQDYAVIPDTFWYFNSLEIGSDSPLMEKKLADYERSNLTAFPYLFGKSTFFVAMYARKKAAKMVNRRAPAEPDN